MTRTKTQIKTGRRSLQHWMNVVRIAQTCTTKHNHCTRLWPMTEKHIPQVRKTKKKEKQKKTKSFLICSFLFLTYKINITIYRLNILSMAWRIICPNLTESVVITKPLLFFCIFFNASQTKPRPAKFEDEAGVRVCVMQLLLLRLQPVYGSYTWWSVHPKRHRFIPYTLYSLYCFNNTRESKFLLTYTKSEPNPKLNIISRHLFRTWPDPLGTSGSIWHIHLLSKEEIWIAAKTVWHIWHI